MRRSVVWAVGLALLSAGLNVARAEPPLSDAESATYVIEKDGYIRHGLRWKGGGKISIAAPDLLGVKAHIGIVDFSGDEIKDKALEPFDLSATPKEIKLPHGLDQATHLRMRLETTVSELDKLKLPLKIAPRMLSDEQTDAKDYASVRKEFVDAAMRYAAAAEKPAAERIALCRKLEVILSLEKAQIVIGSFELPRSTDFVSLLLRGVDKSASGFDRDGGQILVRRVGVKQPLSVEWGEGTPLVADPAKSIAQFVAAIVRTQPGGTLKNLGGHGGGTDPDFDCPEPTKKDVSYEPVLSYTTRVFTAAKKLNSALKPDHAYSVRVCAGKECIVKKEGDKDETNVVNNAKITTREGFGITLLGGVHYSGGLDSTAAYKWSPVGRAEGSTQVLQLQRVEDHTRHFTTSLFLTALFPRIGANGPRLGLGIGPNIVLGSQKNVIEQFSAVVTVHPSIFPRSMHLIAGAGLRETPKLAGLVVGDRIAVDRTAVGTTPAGPAIATNPAWNWVGVVGLAFDLAVVGEETSKLLFGTSGK